MKPCVVGIGGAGGNILKQFLQSQDVAIAVSPLCEPLAYGEVKGLWLESASQDAQRQGYYGNLIQGRYPGYLICHGMITRAQYSQLCGEPTDSISRLPDSTGEAEYLKGVFRCFEFDPELKVKCSADSKHTRIPFRLCGRKA
jgi:hypothetical protein